MPTQIAMASEISLVLGMRVGILVILHHITRENKVFGTDKTIRPPLPGNLNVFVAAHVVATSACKSLLTIQSDN
jgi:hypothetical protein